MKSPLLSPCRLAGLWLSFLLLAIPSYSQNGGLSISGKVVMSNGLPVPNIRIILSNDTATLSSTTSDEHGSYGFYGLGVSVFHLTVQVPDDLPYYADSLTVETTFGVSVHANIFLREKMAQPAKKDKGSLVISTREAAQQIPGEAKKALKKAVKYRDQKKYEAALKELDRATQLAPDYFQAFTEKGIVRIQSGNPREALQDFTRALQLFSDYEPALSGAGYCELTLGRHEQSIGLLEKATLLNPTNARSFLFLGIANLALSRWVKAQSALEHALTVDPQGAVTAHLYLAEALAAQQLFERAADEMHKYLDMIPAGSNYDRLRAKEKLWRAQAKQQGRKGFVGQIREN